MTLPGERLQLVDRYTFKLLGAGLSLSVTLCSCDLVIGIQDLVGDAAADAADAGEAGMMDNGPPDVAVCSGDLSNIGRADFHISFSVTTTQTGLVALANQRSACVPYELWDARLEDGLVLFELADNTNYTPLSSTGTLINDGSPHLVVVQRLSGTVHIIVDGALEFLGVAAESLGVLPPVLVGSDVCDSNDGTAALMGQLTGLCVQGP